MRTGIGRWGQVSLEISVALICVFLLVIAAIKICTWLTEQLAFRQENYESTRTAGSSIDDSGYPQLNIFDTP
jgi:hypothetical protein